MLGANPTTLFAVALAIVVVLITTVAMVYKWLGKHQPDKLDQLHATLPQQPSTVDGPLRPTRYVQRRLECAPAKIFFPVEFHDLIQDVITTFQAQRKEDEYAFAVLLLSKYRNFKDIGTNTQFPMDSEAADCNSRTFPPDDDLINYVTAGPQGLEHAEAILLGKVETLMEKFGEENCKTIILYTWYLPCDSRCQRRECTAKVTNKLGPWVEKGKQVILVYTTTMPGDDTEENPGVSEKKENEIVRDMKAEGIIVLKESYYATLLPLSVRIQNRNRKEGVPSSSPHH